MPSACLDYEDYARDFEAIFRPEWGGPHGFPTAEEKTAAYNRAHGTRVVFSPDCRDNTSIADYVWLPLRFEEPCKKFPSGMVFIDWSDEWSPEEYENI